MSKGGVDYSKWDKLDLGSDSEEEGAFAESDDDCAQAHHERNFSSNESYSPAEIALIQRGITYEKDPDNGLLITGKTKKIKIHPEDKKVHLYSDVIFEEDPKKYNPTPDDGRVHKWGLPQPEIKEDELDDVTRFMENLMARGGGTEEAYMYREKNVEMPEVQFIDALIKRKKRYIDRLAVDDAEKKFTYVVRVEISECEKDVWRRIKVPASIDLSKMHDQVIVPVMGWARGKLSFMLL